MILNSILKEFLYLVRRLFHRKHILRACSSFGTGSAFRAELPGGIPRFAFIKADGTAAKPCGGFGFGKTPRAMNIHRQQDVFRLPWQK
jgi:hypothetical protein